MKGLPLAVVPDRSQVDALAPFVEGRACVVLGSAPLSTATADVATDDVVIAVNGGISSAPRGPDVWVLGSKPYDKPGSSVYPLHARMLAQGKGRHIAHLLLLRGPKVASELWTMQVLRQQRSTWNSYSLLDKPTKLFVEQMLCDRIDSKEPCSSGILAVACALWCGAASVRLAGFSLKPGYHYVKDRPQSWWRNHVAADTRALVALRARCGERLSGDLVQAVAA